MKTIANLSIFFLALPVFMVILKLLEPDMPHILANSFLLSGLFFLFTKLFGKNLPGGRMFKLFQRLYGIMLFWAFVGVGFRFAYYAGWQLEITVGMISTVFCLPILIKLGKIKSAYPEKMPFYVKTGLLPLAFVLLSTLLSFAIPDHVFFEKFSRYSKTMTYDQFKTQYPDRVGYSFDHFTRFLHPPKDQNGSKPDQERETEI